MKAKLMIKFGFIFIVIGIIIITSVEKISAAINEFNRDAEETNNVSLELDKYYTEQNNIIYEFKNNLSDIYTYFNFYAEEFPSKKDKIILEINKSKDVIFEIEKYKQKIDDICSNGIVRENQKEQCNISEINTQSVNNSYSELIKKYNDIVDKYNEFAEKNNFKKEAKLEY